MNKEEPLIDWKDVNTKYPKVFNEICLKVMNVNGITKDWFETTTGQRISVEKIYSQFNKNMQERAYDHLQAFFESEGYFCSFIPYPRIGECWFVLEVFRFENVVKDNTSEYVEDGFSSPSEARAGAVKYLIEVLAKKYQ